MPSIQLSSVDVVYDIPGQSLGGVLARRFRAQRTARPREWQALSSVSLSLQEGDRVGLMGLNGAGKTTLLKVIGGIYAPTRGTLQTRGRVVPLFDIGLGMDPALTGRDNLIARGLFLGMSRSQIREQQDEIIEFADLREHIDLPVSTYSAGMYIRLAFAVSTALTPEILLIDEGLGAGDIAFQSRARERVTAFLARAGIVLMASHDESLLRNYCTTSIVLDRGKVVFSGSLDAGVDYMRALARAHQENS